MGLVTPLQELDVKPQNQVMRPEVFRSKLRLREIPPDTQHTYLHMMVVIGQVARCLNRVRFPDPRKTRRISLPLQNQIT